MILIRGGRVIDTEKKEEREADVIIEGTGLRGSVIMRTTEPGRR